MKKYKRFLVLFAVSVFLIISGTFVFAAIFTYGKHRENEKVITEEYFEDISSAAVKQTQNAYAQMLAETQDAAYLLSVTGSDSESLRRCFAYKYSSTEAQAGLYFRSDGTLKYGDAEYGSRFEKIAKETLESGKASVSNVALCRDGERRFAISVSAAQADGEGGAVLLVYPVSAITDLVDAPILGGEGRVALIGVDGSPVSGRDDAQELNFSPINGSDVSTATQGLTEYGTKTDDKIYVLARPVGINNWLIACAASFDYMDERTGAPLAVENGAEIISISLVGVLTLVAVVIISSRQRKLLLAKRRFNIAVNQSARAAYQYDRKRNRFSFISECENINLPYGRKYYSFAMLLELVHPADRRELRRAIESDGKNGTVSVTVRISALNGTDEFRWYHINATQLSQSGRSSDFVIGSIEDIDEREKERLILRKKATTDALTGLYDRAETQRIVNERLSNLEVNEFSTFCIIDLDNFKSINDIYGHECGDRALLFFSERLKSTFRFGDVIGRLGGDEFAVYMTLTADRQVVERRFSELMKGLSEGGEDQELPEISCSIGYITAQKGDSFQTVYKRADKAMYKAKTAGKCQAVGE